MKDSTARTSSDKRPVTYNISAATAQMIRVMAAEHGLSASEVVDVILARALEEDQELGGDK